MFVRISIFYITRSLNNEHITKSFNRFINQMVSACVYVCTTIYDSIHTKTFLERSAREQAYTSTMRFPLIHKSTRLTRPTEHIVFLRSTHTQHARIHWLLL